MELGRSFRIMNRKIFRPRTISLSGVKLESDSAALPRTVIRALYKERYEDGEADLVRKALEPGDRVLELGAGIGYISLICAMRCGAESVLSYEANPENEALIRRNFALNGLRPNLRNRAISASGEARKLFVAPNILSTGFIERGRAASVMVQCDAIADVIEEFRPNCLVMDIEGAEVDVLAAAPLDGVNKIIVETHPHIVGYEAINLLDENLQSQGYVKSGAGEDGEGKVWLYVRKKL